MPKVVHTNTKGLIQQSGEGVDLQAGLAIGVQSVAAAGNDSQANSTAISASGGALVLVTGVGAGATGVRLPALSSVATGQLFMIQNTTANALDVFPATGDKFLTVADNAKIIIAGNTLLICVKADGDKWVGCETSAMSA